MTRTRGLKPLFEEESDAINKLAGKPTVYRPPKILAEGEMLPVERENGTKFFVRRSEGTDRYEVVRPWGDGVVIIGSYYKTVEEAEEAARTINT